MGLSFVMGGSGAGKSYTAYQQIIKQSIEEPQTYFFVIVPDQFTMQTQMDLVRLHPNKGIMNIDVLSFGRLAHRLFDNNTLNRTILDDTGKSLVLRLIAGRCTDQLKVIGSNLNKIGYIHEVKSSLSEFMQYGIGEEELQKMIGECKGRNALKYKLEDLSVLYREFKDYIANKFITTEETMEVLASMIPLSPLLKDSVILFDGFTGFTPIQNKVIEQMLVTSKQVIVTILTDEGDGKEVCYEYDDNSLFALSNKTMLSLTRMSEKLHVQRERDIILSDTPVWRYKDNPVLGHLEKTLFRYNSRPYTEAQNVIHLYKSSNPKEEVRNTGRLIADLIRQKQYCYRDIAVVTGSLDTYAGHVEEEFSGLGIPFYMDQTRSIVLNPFTEYIRSGIQMIARNFTYDTVFHFLRSGLTGISMEETDLLENYVLALGIRGKSRYNTLFTRHTKETAGNGDTINELNQIREKMMQVISPLTENHTTMGEYCKALYQFIVNANIEKKLKEYEIMFTEQGDYTKAKEYGQIYRLVMQLLEQIYALLSDELIDYSEFAQIIDAGLDEIQVGTIPQSVDRVVVGDMERTRLKEIKVLFFIGVNDGIIPKTSTKGGIISSIDRQLLCEQGWELAPSARQQMYIQRMYLYMNMTKPQNELVVSYSSVDNDGNSIRPSYFIDTLRKIYPSLEIEKTESIGMNTATSLRQVEELFACDLRSRATGENVQKEEERKKDLLIMYQFLSDELFREESSDEADQTIHVMFDTAFREKAGEHLAKSVAAIVYGQVLENSVSRLEKYAACAYSHFLQYGLQLSEREEYTFETKDMGNLFHSILQFFSEQIRNRKYNWINFPQEEGDNILDQAIDACASDYLSSILYSSERNRYILTRLKRIMSRTVQSIQRQLKQGSFLPEEYELSFSSMEDMNTVNIHLSEQEKMVLRGRIDRVDLCRKDDQVYVKVVDYKSGEHDFDLVSVYYGLSLQLVVYLNAAMEYEKKKNPGKEVLPAAILYYKVSDPLVEKTGEETNEEIELRINETLGMKGLVNSNADIVELMDHSIHGKSTVIPVGYTNNGELRATSRVMSTQNMQLLSEYTDHKILEIGRNIVDGKIEKNPCEYNNKDACTYCNFKQVCGFDERIDGYSKRRPAKISDEECLTMMREQMEEENKR